MCTNDRSNKENSPSCLIVPEINEDHVYSPPTLRAYRAVFDAMQEQNHRISFLGDPNIENVVKNVIL
jgi:hypothetical protein